jgi:tRNA-specific 2-thiouridylase
MLTEDNLRRTIFPLADLTKQEVRDIAREHGYPALAEKKESQEICFVTDNDYRSFLRENVTDYDRIVREGNYVNAEGHVLGRHCGYPNYTIGQRKGLGIALGHPAFVTAIRPETNEVVLGTNDDLYQAELTATEVRLRDTEWLAESPVVQARIRYKSQPVDATIESEGTTATLRFAQPVWGITPGQSLVMYKDNLVIGGGIIACPQP